MSFDALRLNYIYEMSLFMVSNWNRNTFEEARRDCLEGRQFNGIYTIGSVGLTWLNYEEFMILRDIIELRFIASTNGKELEFKEWKTKLFSPTSFSQVYKSWISLNNEANIYLTRRQKKVIRLLSYLPQSNVESIDSQELLNEMTTTNLSLNKLIGNLQLSVVDNREKCDNSNYYGELPDK